ncbi:PGF-pre-PGF domain-containing protein, partial [Methanomethylovorans sp.]|uniref:PGF-pre-PGF domain-containing protein n=1 Tax=Methanomethylovorans sp. TaxID=2758717 RepID=UPI003D0E6010
IEENNIDPSTIRMTRYNDGKWEELATQKENDDEEYLYFVAETPGFSIFSVVGDEVKAVSEEAKPVKQEIAEETPEEPVTEEGKETPGFTAAMGLVFVSVAFIVSRRSR